MSKRLSAKQKDTIAEALAKGYPMATAVGLAGVPMKLVQETRRAHKAWDQRLRQARAAGQKVWIDRLVGFAEDGKNTAVSDALKLFYSKDWALCDADGESGEPEMTVLVEGIDPTEV